MKPLLSSLALLSLAGIAAAQTAPKTDNCTPPPAAIGPSLPARLLSGMGTVHFPITTTSPEAQQFFDQGVAQMHSFWSREAERSFLQAAALDPAAPMPHWGIAMIAAGDYRPRFQIDYLEGLNGRSAAPSPALRRAREAAQKAVELSAVPGKATDLEKLYIAAVAARRSPESKDPEEAFVKETRALLARYPNEVEAQLYLSLMIMRGFSLPDKKPNAPGTTEAVAILRSLLPKIPDHPGLHHYIIHAFEGSTFAKDAWPSCEKYAQLVPNIPHALHMPGHIYSQTGRWDDAAKAFAAAAVNERAWMKEDKLYGNSHHGHNVHYLATAYSFEGRFGDAVEAAKELMTFKENPQQAASLDSGSTYSQGWFSMMRTLVQFGKWETILDGSTLPVSTHANLEAWRHWARALALAATNNAAAAREESAQFEHSIAILKSRGRVAPALEVAAQELAGHLDVAEGHLDKGMKQLESASTAERHMKYSEPPAYPRPVAEAMGQIALEHNQTSAAQRAFRIALEQYPSDAHATAGLKAINGTATHVVAARQF